MDIPELVTQAAVLETPRRFTIKEFFKQEWIR